MAEVMHYDIPAGDVQRAIDFYGRVFGWKFEKMPQAEYWLLVRDPQSAGVGGGITQRQGNAPSDGNAANAYVCTIRVDSIDDTARAIVSAGGVMVVEKTDMGMALFASAKDSEGNLFNMMQMTGA